MYLTDLTCPQIKLKNYETQISRVFFLFVANSYQTKLFQGLTMLKNLLCRSKLFNFFIVNLVSHNFPFTNLLQLSHNQTKDASELDKF